MGGRFCTPQHNSSLTDRPFCATPFAAWLLPAYDSTVYVNAFFDLINSRVERVATTFSTILCDAVRFIETNWAEWIIYIELGSLPDIDGLGEYRENLQVRRVSIPKEYI